jgi:type IV pilus assembly protein PilM
MITTWKRIATRAGRFLGKSQDATGVDVGSRFMKSVRLQVGRSCPILKTFAIEAVASNPGYDSQSSREKDKHLVQIFQNQLTSSPHTVGISVSGPLVLFKPLSLPVMTENDLREHLTLELDRYIPFDVQDVVWDIYRHKVPLFFKEGKQEHFLVMAKKEFIEDQIQQFELQGMKISFVDVDTFALVNMVVYNYGTEGTWLIVHLGPTGILSVIIQEGRPVHIRQVSYEAEWYGDLLDRVLLAHEMTDEGYKLGASEMLLLQQFVQETTDQVMEFLKHFSDMSDKAVVSAVLLSGGYSMVEGLAVKLADKLKISVSLVNPFKEIAVPPAIQQDVRFQKVSPLLGVAVGVALRGVVSS